ncbi:MAG: thiamine pyrophosphate-dependent enzyme [Candidatus Woesebacteria bacterium]|jgi:2-oxoglutarate ferredoxin oxidoreductase subunit beta
MSKVTNQSLQSPILPTWCPGCGNYAILAALKQALIQLELEMENVVLIFGIGCSGNMADFIKSYGFHALHGRGIANAIGVKLANHKLKVIVIGGDGDIYGEGLNHLIAAARGNHDITAIIHNNQMYSLTTGQSSPTTDKGTATKSTPTGVIEEAINPLTLTLSSQASFVARAYAGNSAQLVQLIKEAINHEGFSLLDVLQPCPTFNKINTYQWFNKVVYDLAKTNFNKLNKEAAYKKALEVKKLATGILYQNKKSQAYHQQVKQLKNKTLLEQWKKKVNIQTIIDLFS